MQAELAGGILANLFPPVAFDRQYLAHLFGVRPLLKREFLKPFR